MIVAGAASEEETQTVRFFYKNIRINEEMDVMAFGIRKW